MSKRKKVIIPAIINIAKDYGRYLKDDESKNTKSDKVHKQKSIDNESKEKLQKFKFLMDD
jgi:hypothetical protein